MKLRNCLHFAAMTCCPKLVEFVYNTDPRANKIRDYKCLYPIMYAIMFGGLDVVKFLLSKDPWLLNEKSRFSKNLLELAQKESQFEVNRHKLLEIVKYLKEYTPIKTNNVL